MTEKILVTGSAGFIGFHLSKRLLESGYEITGYDNINAYYDTGLKEARLDILQSFSHFSFIHAGLENRELLNETFEKNKFHTVIHLAAQAGVRYSLKNPFCYIDSNITGFMNILEACRNNSVEHLIFASSSSVYGANTHIPFSQKDNTDHPISLYAATKKANELMAHTYSALYDLKCTGLRFFTVYGPYGRPDMAYFEFTRAILSGEPIKVFNSGRMKRDFTYIDDVVDAIARLIDRPPRFNPDWDNMSPSPDISFAPYKIYNIGNNKPVELLYFIEVLENKLGTEANKVYLPLQPGDVLETFADIEDIVKDVGFKPQTSIEEGLDRFIDWFKGYYQIN